MTIRRLKHKQAIGDALNASKRLRRAYGGDTPDSPIQPGQIPQNAEQQRQRQQQQSYVLAHPSGNFADGGDTSDDSDGSGEPTVTGAIGGDSDGRADDVNASVPDGSHVLTSEFVSSLGDGNTQAGVAKLDEMFPDSAAKNAEEKAQRAAMKKAMQPPKAGGIKAAAAPKAAPAMKLNQIKTGAMPKIPSIAKASMSGGAGHSILKNPGHMPRMPHMAGMPRGLKDGGPTKKVKCALSAGEYVVSPHDVKHTVGGGDQQVGHDALDMWMMHRRQHTIKKLASLPPPVKS